ncbi:MAG: enoyl-CoA hydratase, partial [Gammaproteobacteria bacterium]|nr:enoyl-CoA hydratase [Gammaproteobacteria bacterium]
TYLHAAIARFTRMNAPVIMAVHGAAAGAGMSLICGGDIVIAARAAKFTMAYTAIGLPPDGGGSYFLPRVVGLRRAQELILTNRRLSADEALDWGLVTEVVADDALAERAGALAANLASGPTLAYGAAKRLLADTLSNTLETQMELETRAIAGAAAGEDSAGAIQAFLAKQKPTFSGR